MFNASTFPPVREHPVYRLLVDLFPIDVNRPDRSIAKQSRVTAGKLQKTLDSRPKIRTRKTGRVGPELDWSVVYSDVPVDLVAGYVNRGSRSHGRYDIFPFLHDSDPYYEKSTKSTLAKHRCIPTFAMQAHNVALWTEFAMKHCVSFHGERGYSWKRFPDSSQSPEDGLEFFRQLKISGLTSRHRRSDTAKIRRGANRGVREALVEGRSPASLFVRRYAFSAKEMRRKWGCLKPYERPCFKDFKGSCETVLTLFPKGHRRVIPPIVFSSLRRIYSRSCVTRPSDFPWFSKVTNDLKYTLEVPQPPKRFVPPSRILRKGAIVQEYDFPSTMSTIPTLNSDLLDGLDLEYRGRIGGSKHRYARLASDFDWD